MMCFGGRRGDSPRRVFAYRYDAVGRIVSRTHDLGGASFDRDYAYDDFDRLATDGDAAYSYDAAELRAVRYRFQGRERSAATGLTNFRMRWYDAITGRWLSKDPIGLSGGLNLYAFCGGDPVNQVDWIGLCSDDGWWDKFTDEYNLILSNDYGDVLDWADDLGLWGLGSTVMATISGVATELIDGADSAALSRMSLAGANCKGNILAKMAAAAEAENAARGLSSARALMGKAGAATTVVTVGATGFSFGARINAAIRAAAATLGGR